jgi:hypothetical protein
MSGRAIMKRHIPTSSPFVPAFAAGMSIVFSF